MVLFPSPSDTIAAIVGGVVAGVVAVILLILLILLIVCVLKRRLKHSKYEVSKNAELELGTRTPAKPVLGGEQHPPDPQGSHGSSVGKWGGQPPSPPLPSMMLILCLMLY